AIVAKQVWFRDLRFRQAISMAVDRKAMARLAFGGKATPLWGNVTPGNKLWQNTSLTHSAESIDEAKKGLQSTGYAWNSEGGLLDPQKKPVSFTILVSATSSQRSKMAALAQEDLKRLGMDVQVVPIEFRALVDRVLNTKEYEVVLMNLQNSDVDP